MAKVDFNVTCLATYRSELEIPDEIAKKGKSAVLIYIQDHLGACSVSEIEFLDDLVPEEAVTEDDIKKIHLESKD